MTRQDKVFCPRCYEEATHIIAVDPGNPWGLAMCDGEGATWDIFGGKWDPCAACGCAKTAQPFRTIHTLAGTMKDCSSCVVVIEGTYHGKAGRQQVASLTRKVGMLEWAFRSLDFGCILVFEPCKKDGIQWKKELGYNRVTEGQRQLLAQHKCGRPVDTIDQADAVMMASWCVDNLKFNRLVGR